jgi:hypothetical protein
MSSSVTIALQELRAAASWAEEHARTVHDGELPYSDIRIFRISAGGIVVRVVVLCEACDRVRVSDDNHHDVTDYDAA